MLHNQCLFVSTKMIRFFPYNKTSNMCVFLHAWLIKIVEFKIFVTPLLLLFMIHPLYLNLTNWFLLILFSQLQNRVLHINYYTYNITHRNHKIFAHCILAHWRIFGNALIGCFSSMYFAILTIKYLTLFKYDDFECIK